MEEHARKDQCPSPNLHRLLHAHRLRRLETSCGGEKRGRRDRPKLMHVCNKKLNVPPLLALLLSSNHSSPLPPRRLATAAQVAVLLPGRLKIAPLIRPTPDPFNHHSQLEDL